MGNWEGINDEYLIVLKRDEKKQIYFEREKIDYPLKKEINQLVDICSKQEDSVEELTEYIRNTPKLNELSGVYNYCKNLTGILQMVNGEKNEEVLKRIKNKSDKIEKKKRRNKKHPKHEVFLKGYEEVKMDYKILKEKTKSKYILLEKAYSIKKCYKKCRDQENILSYSHRISGWIDEPYYYLNNDFSFRFNINFGFGNSSYFYVTLKYKEIQITPYSDWINYDFVRLSEVKRYSKSFGLQIPQGTFNGENERRYKPEINNSDWFNAMNYIKESFNLYLKDETKFIEKYIINECEKMIEGLERIVNNNIIYLKDKDYKRYNFDIKGHYLMEFKGERISGSLEFINSILKFKKILTINHFIEKIESFNETIKPILKKELEIITNELKVLNIEFEELKQELKRVTKKFNKKNPKHEVFLKDYEDVKKDYKILKEKIKNLDRILKKIKEYHENIENYFLKNINQR